MSQYPREDRPAYEKSVDYKEGLYYKEHLDWAEQILVGQRDFRNLVQKTLDSFNGFKKPGSKAYIERTYGKQNKAAFQSWHLFRTKFNLLTGEYLKRPLSATITTINSEAKSAKMAEMDFMLGAMTAKNVTEKIKAVSGIDLMNGVPIPENEQDPIWQKMSDKDKDETIMQIILNEEQKTQDIKQRFSKMFLDVLLHNMCFCKLEINQEGDAKVYWIDLRDAIFIEVEDDPYLERSPIKGARQWIPVNEVLLRYNLNKDQRDKLNSARSNPTQAVNSSRGMMKQVGNDLMCAVIHIEWDSVATEYTKIVPKTNKQMMIDPSSSSYRMQLNDEEYEKNIDTYNTQVENGKYTIETKYRKVKYEATRIGGLIDTGMGQRKFQARNWDDATNVLNSGYYGLMLNDVDGVKRSLYKLGEKFDDLFNVIQYHKNMALARAKGKALFYDRAGLPEGKKVTDVLHQILNDGFIDWNSAAAGNYAQRGLSALDAIKEVDLGLSQSFEYFLQAEQNCINNINQITGINENRQGDITASATVTNTNSAIQASRTITEPIFYGMNGFTNKVLQGVVDTAAISWAFYKTEKGEQILGTEKHRYLQVTKGLGHKNYGVHVEDGSKYMEMTGVINNAMNISLNAKELRPIDYYKVNMAETLAEKKAVLENSWAEMQKNIQLMQERDNKVKQEIAQMQEQNMKQMALEDREDRQKSETGNIITKGDVQIKVDNNKMRGKLVEGQAKAENDLIMNTE